MDLKKLSSSYIHNVRVVVSDKLETEISGSIIINFRADFISYTDYFPFGMKMPGRSLNTGDIRYGFNGKEKDQRGEFGSNHYDYGFRIYNPAIAKFLSVDPLKASYPWYTPYQFAGNKPINSIDLDGLEYRDFRYAAYGQTMGGTTITSTNYDNLFNQQAERVKGAETPELKMARYAIAGGLGFIATGPFVYLGSSGAALSTLPWLYSNSPTIAAGSSFLVGLLDESGQIQVPGPFDDTGRLGNKVIGNFFRSKGTKKIIEFFGGARSKIPSALNVDKVAEQGLRGNIADFLKFAKNQDILGTVDEIIASGPQADFLEASSELLKSGGRLIINATKGNPFGKLPSGDRLKELGFKVIQKAGDLADEFKGQIFRRTDGSEIPTESVKTTILEKL